MNKFYPPIAFKKINKNNENFKNNNFNLNYS